MAKYCVFWQDCLSGSLCPVAATEANLKGGMLTPEDEVDVYAETPWCFEEKMGFLPIKEVSNE